MKSISQHTEWLRMVEYSGPFLAVTVLEKLFPQGLDAVENHMRKRSRAAYNEWCDAVDESDPQLADLHRAWIDLVLKEILEFEDTVLIPVSDDSEYSYKSPDGNGQLTPDYQLSSGAGEKPKLLISILPQGMNLEKVKTGDGWPVPIFERMILLCRATGVRLGLVTNGERWMLVNAPVASISSYASWYARLWFQEPITLKAFQSLLGVRRWFGPEEETLPAMLDESLENHEEVTDTLGEQVKRAVEVLVQCLDKADQDRNGELLVNVEGAELYEAGLTVMMRLVFVLCAEERGLLLLNDPVYDQYYAITTLRGQLAEESDQHGPEVLERRHDAWARLLAVFRAVYGGVKYESLRMPALGGSLFDPDRFPFLEGRAMGTCWLDTPAQPLPIDNRTVLLLLNALQLLEHRKGALLLSYKALDVEQIGHVYEGLLEHTVQRLSKDTLGLTGSQKAKNPNISLSELESAYLDGYDEVAKLIKDSTQRGLPAIKNALKKDVDEETFGKIITVCGGDMALANRIRPFAHLLRTDAWGDFIVYRSGSFTVTLGADRRETGTHYTPKSLTESIVEATLEPIAYVGSAEGTPREKWQLKSSAELLDLKICDPAMGSGAFLVQVCRCLSERIVEAWGREIAYGKFITVDGIALDEPGGAEPMPDSLDDRLLVARRLVAERCIYGVDLNPLAVELAKLSIWLITLAKGRPFGFLDHNLRSGDSLIGLHRLEQLTRFSLHPENKKSLSIFTSNIEETIREVLELRAKLRKTMIRDIRDVQYMERLDQEAKQKIKHVEHIADALIGEVLASGGNERRLEIAMDNLSTWATAYIEGDDGTEMKIIAKTKEFRSIELISDKPPCKPFHWVLEFPEVFEIGGFDGIVGNPPFMGGHKITGILGTHYREFIVRHIANNVRGRADLAGYFILKSSMLINKNGVLGIVSTNTISQGDTREITLDRLVSKKFKIIKAVSSLKWPGKANLEIALVWLKKGKWDGECILDGKNVSQISPFLEDITTYELEPFKLNMNKRKSFQGSKPYGAGFVLSQAEAEGILSISKKYNDVIYPYLIGRDVNSNYDQRPSRWVINFFDWPKDKAKSYTHCWDIIEQRVRPERQRKNEDGSYVVREPMPTLYWIYGEKRPALYSTIKELKKVLVVTQVTPYHGFVFHKPGIVFDQRLIIIAQSRYCDFAILQSAIFNAWMIKYGSSLRKDPVFTPSKSFETFPFIGAPEKLNFIGEKFYVYRSTYMNEQQYGITDIYKLFHSAEHKSDGIQTLRDLQIEMDNAVAVVYGWSDLDLDHGFRETGVGKRFTISEEANREVLQRLLKLNHERYNEEVRRGFHNKKNKKIKARRGKKISKINDMKQRKLFEDGL